MSIIQDFQSPILPTWCPGCGDFAVWSALKQAFVQEGLGPTDVVLCFDIGCNSNMADKINAYVFKGLHGRVIPIAEGISLANSSIPIIAISGDGGTYDEGMQHFVHTIRSNYDITLILHNNCDFGLTTGQATPTTPIGQKMNGAVYGVVESRLNPTQLALTLGASFVAKAFTGNIPQLVSLIRASMKHKGFSYLEVLQHCPTYNSFQDHKWIAEKVYDVNTLPDYKNNDLRSAMDITDYSKEKIATGIIFEDQNSVDYLTRVPYRTGVSTLLKDEVKQYPIAEITKEFV